MLIDSESERAVRLYCKAGKFKKACDVNRKHDWNYSKLLEKEALLQLDLKRNELLKAREEYLKRLTRLRVVQSQKKKMQPSLGGLRAADGGDAQSDVSESSQASNLSALPSASRMTRQSKKKHRKKQKPGTIRIRNVKEGTPFEEEMLVDILSDFKPTEAMRSLLRELSDVLVLFGYFKESRDLGELFKEFSKLVSRRERTLLQKEAAAQIEEFDLLFPSKQDDEEDDAISLLE